MTFTKLKELVGAQFEVENIIGYTYKKWDNDNKTMLTSDKPEKGYAKKYSLETSRGTLDLGVGQIGNMLESAMRNGKSDLNGKTFSVKSNGKTGIDIRYYLNLVNDPTVESESRNASQPAREPQNGSEGEDESGDADDVSQIPF